MVTAQIAGFVTRAEAGLGPARSYSSNIRPGLGGVALHYGGPPVRIRTHEDCVRTWRAWYAFHTGPERGWADIAYTMGVCSHGYAFAGRGARRRTAANGTNAGNDAYYAVCWIGGEGQTLTPKAADAFAWCVHELRTSGGAGRRVRPHSFFKGTGCPGDPTRSLAATLDLRDLRPSEPQPTIEESDDMRYTLIRVAGDPKVYAVRPGKIVHVPSTDNLYDLADLGLTVDGRTVEIVDQARLDRLMAFLPTA
jgi:hypothetical protein